jgi:SAM-dependent methyltransferase
MTTPPALDAAALSRLYGTGEVMAELRMLIRGEVLDFGAGQGKQKRFVQTRCPGVTRYTALDIEPHPNVDVVADVLSPNLPEASFDTVISNQVIEHVREPWVMVREIARLLRPGGHAILTAPFLVPYHAHPTDYFRFTEEGLRSLCGAAGLEEVLCTKHGGFGAVAGELVRHSWFSPYAAHPRWKRLLGRWVERFCRCLNRLTPPGAVYASVVCVARKP